MYFIYSIILFRLSKYFGEGREFIFHGKLGPSFQLLEFPMD